MPRVLQVDSLRDLNANTRGNRTSDDETRNESSSEDEMNRNHNQTENEFIGDKSSGLRFPINYELYNVIYTPSENDAYCLTCNIGGKIVKYKKDARVWLHKSRERKRKYEEMEENTPQMHQTNVTIQNFENSTCEVNNDNHEEEVDCKKRLVRIQQYFCNVRSAYEKYRMSGETESEISSLGDSEADLTYSEETTPTVSLTRVTNKNTTQQIHASQSGKNQIGEENDKDNLLCSSQSNSSNDSERQDISDFLTLDELDSINASGNNNKDRVNYYEVTRRIAPAIDIEKESFHESLLDSAVNTFTSDCVAANTRFRSRQRCRDHRLGPTGNTHHKRNTARRDASQESFYNLRFRRMTTGSITKAHQTRRNQKTSALKIGPKDTSNNSKARKYRHLVSQRNITANHGQQMNIPNAQITVSARASNKGSSAKTAIKELDDVRKEDKQAADPGPSSSSMIPPLSELCSAVVAKYFTSVIKSLLINEITQ